MDYAAALWSPYKQKHTDAIENVQRRATKQLPGMRDLQYPDRLKKLGLLTLAYRRVQGDMIETYKLLHEVHGREVADVLTLCKESAGMDSICIRCHSLN